MRRMRQLHQAGVGLAKRSSLCYVGKALRQPAMSLKSRIIQISTNSSAEGKTCLYALDEDGDIWELLWTKDGYLWEFIGQPSQAEK